METSHQPPEKRHTRFLNALGMFVPVLGILATIGYMALYLALNDWQMLAVAIASAVATAGFAVAKYLLNRGRDWPAAALMIIIAALLMITFPLFWAGTTLVFVVGVWVVTGMIAWMGLPPGYRRSISFFVSALASAAMLVIDVTAPFERLQVTDLEILRWLVPLIVLLGGALALLIMIRGIATGRLFTRLLLSFLLIVIIPVVTLGTASTIERVQSDQGYAENNLSVSINRKESAISTWLEGIQGDVVLAARDVQILGYMRDLLTLAPGENPDPLHSRIVERFFVILYQSNRLQELFLMNADGIVVADTLSINEGDNYQYQEFFWQGRNGLFLNPPFYSNIADEISIIVSYPITDSNGEMIGVLAGRANMSRFNVLVSTPDTDNAQISFYLVDTNYDLLTSSAIGAPTRVENDATRSAITNQTGGVIIYNNYRGESVISVYRWIPEIKSVLLAELPQQVAFANVGSLVRTNIGLAILTAAIAVLGAFFTIRTLSEPINRLAAVARQVAAGNLNARAEVEQEDEIGMLAKTVNDMTTQLQGLVTDLEKRVEERTRDLERRTVELQTAAEVARDASIAENMDELLNRAARLIRERFGFYHVGIFLVDENAEYAILRAAGGEAGQLMLASKHRLRVGEVGIVGYVTKTGDARIALDTGSDAIHFRNPLLPYTHSEMALPFKVGDRVIGALDVQSDKTKAFDRNDIAIMQVMADQLAVAIEKARLLQEVERSVQEMERSYREYTARTWRAFTQQPDQQLGYRYEGIAPEPLTAPPPESMEAIEKGTSVILRTMAEKVGSILAVPIRLRGQTIGTLNLRFQGREIPAETSLLVEEAAGRLALALENARLVQDAQRLATRERQVNVITSQIQQATDLDTILKNTIRELGNTLGVPRTFIQIGITPSDETNPDKDN